MTLVSFAGLRTGEISLDIMKSLYPLVVALDPRSSHTLIKLRAQRQALSAQVVQVINVFGPKIFPEFESERLVSDVCHDDHTYDSKLKSMPHSEPETSDRSRISSPGDDFLSYEYPSKPITIDPKDDLGDVNKRIRESMQEWSQWYGKAQSKFDGDCELANSSRKLQGKASIQDHKKTK